MFLCINIRFRTLNRCITYLQQSYCINVYSCSARRFDIESNIDCSIRYKHI